ncbi:MAG: Rpn family recombination-promoting nuclease/putative transposase [Saprospiraceae bacterium]|nr:Rpn family recombination-promoting nuclease/putative transposase [Saprospiraceae bacterium]
MSKTYKQRNRDHDIFLKGILSLDEMVLLLLHRYLPLDLQRYVDFSTLRILSETHIDNKLVAQYSDSIHECALKVEELPETVRNMPDLPVFRFCFLWEHKSHKPYEPIESQQERYRYAIISSDKKNKRSPSTVIPILIYHGATKWNKKMLYEQFEPYLPPEILDFIPHPKYIIIDIQAITEAEIEKMVDLGVLRAAFLTLKNAHKKNFFQKDMGKALKFVEKLPIGYVFQEFFKMLLAYMERRSELESDKFNAILEQNLKEDMVASKKTMFEIAEEKAELRGIEKGYVQGMEKGIEEGIEKGIEKGTFDSIIKLWQKGIEPNMISNLLDLDIQHVNQIIADFQKQEPEKMTKK